MDDEPRRSNSKDWDLVHMPRCPKCGDCNLPWMSPVIELVGTDYFCSTCSHSWPGPKG